jgi:hypothetical protein
MDFDFALLKLASPVALSANVSYICLPPGIFKREICITLMMMFSKFYFSQ